MKHTKKADQRMVRTAYSALMFLKPFFVKIDIDRGFQR